ncbi:MAG TPA: heme-binding domain-containing protein [Parafilimonas sp.]|nr:heme-binding domain-containing protein [Parafilimonas sp.]
MSKSKKIIIAVVIVFIAIQFIRPKRNIDTAEQQGDFIKKFNVPANVAGVLKTSCYDCHSNSTRYPWYANVQPMAWLLANHINNGKAELNFSEFAGYSKRRQLSKLKAVANSVHDGSMPLSSYILIHSDAKLDDSKKQLLTTWFSKTKDSLDAQQ